MKKQNWLCAIALLLTALFLNSCKLSEDLARSRSEKFYQEHPDEFAQRCAVKYPPQVSKGGVTYSKGVDKDTSYQIAKKKADSMINSALAWQPLDVDVLAVRASYEVRIDELTDIIRKLSSHACVPDTLYRTDTIADTRMLAEVAALKAQVRDQQITLKNKSLVLEDWKTKAKRRNWILIGLYSVIGLAAVAAFVKAVKTINIKK